MIYFTLIMFLICNRRSFAGLSSAYQTFLQESSEEWTTFRKTSLSLQTYHSWLSTAAT